MQTLRNRKPLRLGSLVDDTPVLSDLHVVDRIIQGPAIAIPWECIFEQCVWSTDFDSTFWPLSSRRPKVTGAIELERCHFVRCTFIGVGIAAPEEQRHEFEKMWS